MLYKENLINSIFNNKSLFLKNKTFLSINLKKKFLFNSSSFFKSDKYRKVFFRKFLSYIYFLNFLTGFIPKIKLNLKYNDLKKKKKNLEILLQLDFVSLKNFFSFITFISFFRFFFKSVFIESEWFILKKKNIIYLGLKNFMFLDKFFLKNYKDFFYQEKNFIFFKIIFKKNIELKWFEFQLLKILNEKK